MKILVVGGAGYVGSATCARLLDCGHDVWIMDNLSTGYRDLALGDKFLQAAAGDRAVVSTLLARERFDGVMHFAARSLVEESVRKPDLYYENNVIQTRDLLELMLANGIRRFIFSSSCAVFGDPGADVISESLPKKPIQPYGATKLEVERMMEQLAGDQGLQSIALRYFNAAGAEPKLRVGEKHNPETHLIPRILKSARCGKPVEIYGTDYPTPDGTCIRDYIHVSDLAEAHEAAMMRLMGDPVFAGEQGRFEAYNLGSEKGFSVREIVAAGEKAVGTRIEVIEKPRRAGDPPRLVADSTLARRVLGFKPKMNLDRIFETAWKWETRPKRAVFLDRDGTLNPDPGYINDPAQVTLFDGVAEALFQLKNRGFLLVVVSNQSGVGRGTIPPEAIPRIHDRFNELLEKHSVRIDHWELCFHHPDENCDCRKPKPKLLQEAARKLGIDLKQSFMVGDKIVDIECGRAAGCQGVALVRTGYGADSEKKLAPGSADFIGDSLQSVANWIPAPKT